MRTGEHMLPAIEGHVGWIPPSVAPAAGPPAVRDIARQQPGATNVRNPLPIRLEEQRCACLSRGWAVPHWVARHTAA